MLATPIQVGLRPPIKSPRRKIVTAVDLFCGAGGMSTGMLEAFSHLGIQCDLTAINHWPIAVETHGLNHPNVKHLCEDISNVNPRKLFREGGVNILVGGPSCVTHSSARGGRPIDCDQDRATPWCMVRWAESTLPDVIIIENVPQLLKWGPLIRKRCPVKEKVPKYDYETWRAMRLRQNKPVSEELWASKCPKEKRIVMRMQWIPDKTREGETFQAWIQCLRALGYTVDWRVLCTANYGDPTTRERLFVMATRGKRKPVWPLPTHSEDGLTKNRQGTRNWVKTRRIIDWNVPSRSIFDREKPLVDKTLRRVWIGFQRYSLPKIIEAAASRNNQTVEAKDVQLYQADENCFLVKFKGTGTAENVDKPITTIQSSGKHHGLAQVQAKKISPAVTEEFVVRYHGMSNAESMERPVSTVESQTKHYVAQTQAAFVAQLGFGEKNPKGEGHRVQSTDDTLKTVTGSNNWYLGETKASFVVTIDNQGKKGTQPVGGVRSIEDTTSVVTSKARHTLVESEAKKIATLKTKGKKKKDSNELAFLIKYFRTGIAKSLDSTLDTATSKDRFGLVIPELIPFNPETEGLPKKGRFYIQILDSLYEIEIKLRMFEPHELALAQGFPKSYRFAGNKTEQVRQIGNAVPRRTVRALTLAAWTQNENVPFLEEFEDIP